MPLTIPESPANDDSAQPYAVANRRIVSIEHPCIVHDPDKGLKSLGGEHQLKQILEPKKKSGNDGIGLGSAVAVSFRPHDVFAQKILSTAVVTHNVLIKVTLPKKTGRKRKRESDEPFEGNIESTYNDRITPAELLERMRGNAAKYRIEPVGVIEETHRFNRLPDYQLRASEAPVMQEIRDHIAEPQYDNLRKFRLDSKPESENLTCFPGPPVFTKGVAINLWESHRESPRTELSSKPKLRRRRPRKSFAPAGRARNEAVAMDSEKVPQGPPSDLPPPTRGIERAIGPMKALLEKRPLVTCRAAFALLKEFPMKIVASTIPYVGYLAGKGPWCDAIVKYGIDPRSDPKYRKYQTLIFRAHAAKEVNAILQQRAQDVETHVFNGQTMSKTAAIWQLCDLTDPLIVEVLNTPDIRTDCDTERHGWYFNGTIAKVRVLMREKMRCILNELPMPADDYYRVLNELPNLILDKENCELPASYPFEVRQLAQDVAKASRKGQPKSYKILKNEIDGEDWDSGTNAAQSAAEDDEDDEDEGDENEDVMDSGEDDVEELPETHATIDMRDEPLVERA